MRRQVGRNSSKIFAVSDSPEPKSTQRTMKDMALKSVKCTGRIVALSGLFQASREMAAAQVFFDGDAYGDKELKVATLNKLKQTLRNSMTKNPDLALSFFELAVTDALGFDVSSEDGGLDGSIVFEEAPSSFTSAIKALRGVQEDLSATNAISFADCVAFGGGEALETVGSARVTVQLGRADAKKANAKAPSFDMWRGDSSEAPVKNVKKLFASAGLTARDIAALLCAHGEIRRILRERQAKMKPADMDGSGDDDEEAEEQDFVPSSFGRRDMMYGEKLSSGFSTAYVKDLLQAVKKTAPSEIRLSLLDRTLIEDEEIRAVAAGFASSGGDKFSEAVVSAYIRLCGLGQKFSRRID
jgi:hypothetical protein